MTVATLTTFLGWCTVINMGFLAFLALVLLVMPDLTYRLQVRFAANMERKEWDLVMYGFMGVFKVMVIVFNVVPWIALKIMA